MGQPETTLLANMELFAGLPSDLLTAAATSARSERLPRNHLIFEQGARAERAYALAEGSVRIVQTGRDGAQVVIRFIGPGDMFGTAPLFTDHLFPADAITAETSHVLSWSEADLQALLEACPKAAMNVIRILGARLVEVQERVRELSTQGVERRVAHALLRLAAQAGRPADGGTEIHLRLRRKDLADVSGTTLHTASRLLAAWQKAGVLISEKQRLTISNLARLQRIAEGGGRLLEP